ncbi:MAG: PAS domain S-box protein [Methanothrix sp.]|nr:PAS domain S-box protein [Methanothrix sp.]
MNSEQLCQSALNALSEAICLCDKEGRVLFMNSAARTMTGWKDDDGYVDLNSNPGRVEIGGRSFLCTLHHLQDGDDSAAVAVLKCPHDENSENDPGRWDRFLAGAALATNQLLITEEIDLALSQSLEFLGCSSNVDRVYIFQNYDTDSGEHRCMLSYDWTREGLAAVTEKLPPLDISYSQPVPWYDPLAQGMPMRGLTRDQPERSRILLQQWGVKSFLIVPIFTKGSFWGFIGFDDRSSDRIWTWGEVSVLMTIAGAIGGSIERWQTQAALAQSEKKYRELVESANSIILRLDRAGNITFINKFAEDFFGYPREEILGRNVVGSIVPPVDSENQDLKRMMADLTRHPSRYASNVNENMRSNGERVWIAWTNRAIKNEKGEMVEVLCIGNDLTEVRRSSEKLKKTAEDLRETRDFLENLIGHANAPIIVWDPLFRITRFNHAAERLTGQRSEDILGRNLDILFPGESRNEYLAYIEKTLSGEHWDAVEIPILRKDGDVRTVLWNSATIYDEGGKKVMATIAQGQDITERKEAESQVTFQASLLNQVRNAVIATDLDGKIIYWNHFSEILYQWKADEVLGRSIADTIVPAQRRQIIREVMEEIVRCGYLESEFVVQRKDGSLFPALYVFNMLKDQKGRNMGFASVSIDLTERKRVEDDLLLAKERAESATRAKSQFLANMSHEIRTPMNAVIGLTSLLLNTPINPEQRDYIETIRSSGDSLLAVISDILDFSKIEGGMLELESKPFDLQRVLEDSMSMVASAARGKGLDLSYSLEPDVPRQVLGDPARLKQILVNLLGNAVKFTEKGEISATVSTSGPSRGKHGLEEIMFAVKDTGIGISKEHMGRLFLSFSQADPSTTRKYGGTGLGLVISKNLAERMGGRIWAESETGKGSVFYFTVKARASPGLLPAPQEDILPGPLAEFDGQGKSDLRILLAEDNAVNQMVALRMLERLGYRADTAVNGQEVLEALQNRSYDIVLMDVQMPEMDGLEAARRIRSSKSGQPYIIAMTAHAMKGDREVCMEAGMNDYVSKPVRMEELRAAIMRSLKNRI